MVSFLKCTTAQKAAKQVSVPKEIAHLFHSKQLSRGLVQPQVHDPIRPFSKHSAAAPQHPLPISVCGLRNSSSSPRIAHPAPPSHCHSDLKRIPGRAHTEETSGFSDAKRLGWDASHESSISTQINLRNPTPNTTTPQGSANRRRTSGERRGEPKSPLVCDSSRQNI